VSAVTRVEEAGLSRTAPPAGDWRVLSGWAATGRPQEYADHQATFGPLPTRAFRGSEGRRRLVEEVARAGLRGRGGAAFPAARKLAAVLAGRGRPVVVANGCEGEPASAKDRVLSELAPHLVIDGALLAALATGAREVYLCVEADAASFPRLSQAARERPSQLKVSVVGVPGHFVASEESALVSYLNGGPAKPTSKPPRVFESGVGGRPTYVGNFETLAHLALIARYGADWFRTAGTAGSPGTALVTVDGAVHRPGVAEVPYGVSLAEVLDAGGGVAAPLQALLVGGYAGRWLPVPAALHTQFSHEGLQAAGASVGVGAVIALPSAACGIAETAHVLHYLAGQSARQCGPCMFGLPAIAADFAALTAGSMVSDARAMLRLERRLATVRGRGACAHPDGAVGLAQSALLTFQGDVAQHLAGRPCPFAGTRPRLPLLQPGLGVLLSR
jgi:NADH:ubiquinone oxidoreductase subunit F (NADH-binding)